MKPTRKTPQHGLTLALLAIQTEHPELANLGPVEWTVSQLGVLYGKVDAVDGEAVAAAYQAVVGGDIEPPLPFSWGHQDMTVRILDVMWRDARVQIRVVSPVQAAAGSAVAA
ncbi:hypothetical protein [Kitasatospora sp. NPDC050543]|uniref:hypothetical protein n=1 Tax=Kitasatospora sp. NPDC050543 TaxID=3364054 RepID=UPI0037A2805E